MHDVDDWHGAAGGSRIGAGRGQTRAIRDVPEHEQADQEPDERTRTDEHLPGADLGQIFWQEVSVLRTVGCRRRARPRGDVVVSVDFRRAAIRVRGMGRGPINTRLGVALRRWRWHVGRPFGPQIFGYVRRIHHRSSASTCVRGGPLAQQAVDDGDKEKRRECGHEQPADDRPAQRRVLLTAFAETQ